MCKNCFLSFGVAFLSFAAAVGCDNSSAAEEDDTGGREDTQQDKNDPSQMGLPICSADETPDTPQQGSFEVDVSDDTLAYKYDGSDEVRELRIFLPKTDKKVPFLVFINGGTIDGYRYNWLGESVASNGTAAFVIQKNTKHDTDRLQWPAAVLSYIQASGLDEKIDTNRLVIGGHSFGGLLALCLASPGDCPLSIDGFSDIPSEISGVFTLNSHAQPLDGSQDKSPIATEIPIMMVQGTQDGYSDVSEVSATFDRIAGSSKRFLVTIQGENHYQATSCLIPDVDNYHRDLYPEISHETALARNAKAILHYLAYLKTKDSESMSALDDEEGMTCQAQP